MIEREPTKRRRGIVIYLDENPELAEVLEQMSDKPSFSRANAVAGEQLNPRRGLRRGLHPQE